MRAPCQRTVIILSFAAGICLFSGNAAWAAPEETEESDEAVFKELIAELKLQKGPAMVALGSVAKIKVPKGFVFANKEKTAQFMEMCENPVDGSELGCVIRDDGGWFVLFSFEDVGYVPDDDAGKLDSAEILKALREGSEEGNAERKKRGWAPVTVTGWARPPKYNKSTHNLEWAPLATSGGDQVVNFNTRLLGRKGVMSANLVVGPEELDEAEAPYRGLLSGFAFQTGNSYAEFRKGDKIAKYGLTTLMTGGAAAVAIKTGLFKKLWKLIVVVGAAVAAGLRKLFRRGSD